MTIQDYQKEAKRTLVDLPLMVNKQHMLLGLISEAGELADAYKKHIAYGKQLDKVNVLEEIGDLMWYAANLANITNEEIIRWSISSIKPYPCTTEVGAICKFIEDIFSMNPSKCVHAINTLGISLGLTEDDLKQALQNNIDKLKVRYPEKFTEENALNRDLEAERKELSK